MTRKKLYRVSVGIDPAADYALEVLHNNMAHGGMDYRKWAIYSALEEGLLAMVDFCERNGRVAGAFRFEVIEEPRRSIAVNKFLENRDEQIAAVLDAATKAAEGGA